METLSTWLHMDGYGLYVWASYGVTALIVIGLTAATLYGSRSARRTLDLLEKSGRRRDRGAA